MHVVVSEKQNTRAKEILRSLKDHSAFLVLLLFMLIGMLCGSLSVHELREPYLQFTEKWFDSFLSERVESSFFDLFFDSFLSSSLFIALTIISSIGISGIPMLPLAVFLRGFCTSAVFGLLYRDHSLQGIAFADLLLLPSNLCFNFLLLLISANALKLSFDFLQLIKKNGSESMLLKAELFSFFRKILYSTAVFTLISAAEALFTVCFIKYFNFN